MRHGLAISSFLVSSLVILRTGASASVPEAVRVCLLDAHMPLILRCDGFCILLPSCSLVFQLPLHVVSSVPAHPAESLPVTDKNVWHGDKAYCDASQE